MFWATAPYLVMSPQYHSASCSEYTGGKMQLLFMVEETGFGLDLGGSAGVGRGEAKNEIEKMMH